MSKLFGFSIEASDKVAKSVVFPVPPNNADGVDNFIASGFYGQFVDIEGVYRTEHDLIKRYREMAIHPESDNAIEDVVNEAIVSDSYDSPVEIELSNVNASDKLKDKIREEFRYIKELLDFDKKSHEIFRNWYVDGRLYYHKLIDLKNPDLNKLGIFMAIESARNYVSSEEISTHIIIDKEQYYDEEKIVKDLSQILSEDYEIMTWKKTLPEIEQTITADNAGGLIMAFILYIIVVFGMFGTVLMMTEERKYEFGVLISIGMSRVRLFGIILIETIILSMIGVFLAIILTYPISYYFNLNPIDMAVLMGEGADQMLEDLGFSPLAPMSISWDIPLSHALVIFIFSLLISIYPAIKILNLNPVKSMKI